MLVGSVVDDEIEDDADAALLALGDEAIEIRERAVHGIDVFVVGDVVAEIDLRRRKARRDPDGVDPERVQIIELRSDPVQIANAVVVAVGEAARIEFIEDRGLPPRLPFGISFLFLRAGAGREDAREDGQYCENCDFGKHGYFLRRTKPVAFPDAKNKRLRPARLRVSLACDDSSRRPLGQNET